MEHDGEIRDEAALLRAAADDPAAFARFYRHHVHGVIAYFHRRTGDAEAAADLTAETFAAALEGCHRYAPDRGAPAAWLYGIATGSSPRFSATATSSAAHAGGWAWRGST